MLDICIQGWKKENSISKIKILHWQYITYMLYMSHILSLIVFRVDPFEPNIEPNRLNSNRTSNGSYLKIINDNYWLS